MQFPLRNPKRGSALIIALILLAALALVASISLRDSTLNTATSGSAYKSERAMKNAETGLNVTAAKIAQNYVNFLSGMNDISCPSPNATNKSTCNWTAQACDRTVDQCLSPALTNTSTYKVALIDQPGHATASFTLNGDKSILFGLQVVGKDPDSNLKTTQAAVEAFFKLKPPPSDSPPEAVAAIPICVISGGVCTQGSPYFGQAWWIDGADWTLPANCNTSNSSSCWGTRKADANGVNSVTSGSKPGIAFKNAPGAAPPIPTTANGLSMTIAAFPTFYQAFFATLPPQNRWWNAPLGSTSDLVPPTTPPIKPPGSSPSLPPGSAWGSIQAVENRISPTEWQSFRDTLAGTENTQGIADRIIDLKDCTADGNGNVYISNCPDSSSVSLGTKDSPKIVVIKDSSAGTRKLHLMVGRASGYGILILQNAGLYASGLVYAGIVLMEGEKTVLNMMYNSSGFDPHIYGTLMYMGGELNMVVGSGPHIAYSSAAYQIAKSAYQDAVLKHSDTLQKVAFRRVNDPLSTLRF